jgi:hypothetical protein
MKPSLSDESTETEVEDLDLKVEEGEASFPAPEEIRSSDTSRAEGDKSKRRSRCLWIAFGFMLFILVVVVPSVGVRRRNRKVRMQMQKVAEYFVSEGVSNQSSFDDPEAPHNFAVWWLVSNGAAIPNSESSPAEINSFLLRYVLALAYFALNGDDWDDDLNFLSGWDVCEWNSESDGLEYGVVCDQEVPVEIILCKCIFVAYFCSADS